MYDASVFFVCSVLDCAVSCHHLLVAGLRGEGSPRPSRSFTCLFGNASKGGTGTSGALPATPRGCGDDRGLRLHFEGKRLGSGGSAVVSWGSAIFTWGSLMFCSFGNQEFDFVRLLIFRDVDSVC